MKGLIFLLVTLCFNISAYPQSLKKTNKRIERISDKLEDTWVGTIVFNDNTEFIGKFSYNPLIEVLLVKANNTVQSYGTNAVRGFSFTDDNHIGRRYFYSLYFNNEGPQKYFFELIYDNESISILSQNSFTARNVYTDNPYSGVKKTNNPKVKKRINRWLVDHRDNKMYEFTKRELLRMTDDKKENIAAFIKENKFFYKDNVIEDYITVIDFYSSLKKQNP